MSISGTSVRSALPCIAAERVSPVAMASWQADCCCQPRPPMTEPNLWIGGSLEFLEDPRKPCPRKGRQRPRDRRLQTRTSHAQTDVLNSTNLALHTSSLRERNVVSRIDEGCNFCFGATRFVGRKVRNHGEAGVAVMGTGWPRSGRRQESGASAGTGRGLVKGTRGPRHS